MRRRTFALDPETERRLRQRARAHGVSQAAYVRALINSRRPGATPGSDVAVADAWWDSRPPSRRVSVWRNHANRADTAEPADAEQFTIFDGERP